MRFSVWLLAVAGALVSSAAALAQDAPSPLSSGAPGGFEVDPLFNMNVQRLLPERRTQPESASQDKEQSRSAKDCANAGGKVGAEARIKACGKLIDAGMWKGGEIAWAYSNRCFAFFKLGQRDKALPDCAKAIELDRKNAIAFETRGMIEQDAGDSDKALADFDKAVELGVKSPSIYSDRGNLLLAKGETDKALADYDRAVELNGGNATSLVERAAAWVAKGDADKAIADYDKAIALAPKDAFAFFNRGVAFFLKGDKAKAIDDFQQAVNLGPTNPYPALWLFLSGDPVEQKAALKKRAGTFAKGAWPWPVVEFDLEAIDADKAIASAKTPGERCEAQFYVGAALLAKKQRDDAIAHWRRAADICPRNFVEYSSAVLGLRGLGLEAQKADSASPAAASPKAEQAPSPTSAPAAAPPLPAASTAAPNGAPAPAVGEPAKTEAAPAAGGY